MIQTRRERVRDATREEILSTAWKQIGEVGAPPRPRRAPSPAAAHPPRGSPRRP